MTARTSILAFSLALAVAASACSGGALPLATPTAVRATPSAPPTRVVPGTPGPTPDFARSLPGAAPRDAALAARLADAWTSHGGGHRPRTRHVDAAGAPLYTNRLLLEASPYLLQHAHNPVDWYPWGDEAFATARRLGRPVLLSIGYSTCHWCHVMEEESFDDEEIARFLNEHYVAIKVDREERPDLDAVYMSAVLALTGSGGWPMTVWVTPDREPFFAGTYFPARDGDRGVATGFLSLLLQMKAIYETEPDRVAAAARELTQAVRARSVASERAEEPVDASVLAGAVERARRSYDPVWGGAARVPKFPSAFPIRLLLRSHRRTGDPETLAMAATTLEKMAAGGMRDQLGGGFHRYSTDRRWLVPHFEKMLYDNALLAIAYLEGAAATGRADLAAIARTVLDDVEREFGAPDGGFFSAIDADSRGPDGRLAEGLFYTWTPAEIEAALGRERATTFAGAYGITTEGNFEGRSILFLPKPLDETARDLGVARDALGRDLAASRDALLAARAHRVRPFRDEKVLAAWNGLAISAFARAALALGEPAYAERAARAADFVLGRMQDGARLHRAFVAGRPAEAGLLEDYAFTIAGLLDLYEATGDPRRLRAAIALDAVLAEHFEDRDAGGFFGTPDDGEALLTREKPSADGAEPSGNSVELLNLLRLHDLTGDERYRARADRALAAFGKPLRSSPEALDEMLLAVDWRLDVPKEIAIVAPAARSEAEPFLAELRRAFVPNRVLAIAVAGRDLDLQAEAVPLLADKTARGGRATAYVCEHRVCKLPTNDPAVFARQIAPAR
ncbi:MAG TPA: thioredoxin domain-containing protein [Candidatus Binatia bacterium]|nr:thioredoxin domain-containing protein [Candidatus Binatia bacterium]